MAAISLEKREISHTFQFFKEPGLAGKRVPVSGERVYLLQLQHRLDGGGGG